MIASELQKKALSDNTPYEAREVGEAVSSSIGQELAECASLHRDLIDEPEFCIVRLIGKDKLLPALSRIKYYAWPFLPSPRPNQAVFLYDKRRDEITKRLWVLPNALTMADLASRTVVPDDYKTMQAWSIAFFEGKFWEYVRYDQKIDMLSEHEYALQHRQELLKACADLRSLESGQIIHGLDVQPREVIQSHDVMSLE